MSLSTHAFLTLRAAAGAFALVACTALAQPSVDALTAARARLEARDPAGALALLEPEEIQRAGDPEFDYLLGIAALDTGQATRAIFALERVLAAEPGNHLARAEIARAYLLAGERDIARSELVRARAGNMPPAAAAAIDRVLDAMATAEPMQSGRALRAYLEMAAGWDSNVNSATAVGQFAVPAFGGAIFTLAPASQRRSDEFLAVAGGASLRMALTAQWALTGAINARRNANRHHDELEAGLLDASVGAAYTAGPHILSAGLQSAGYWLGAQSYRTARGATAQWQWVATPADQFSFFGQWSRLHYPGQSARDADRSVLGAGYARAFNAGAELLYGSVYAAHEGERAAGAPHFGHQGAGLRIGGEITRGTVTFFTTIGAERRGYGGPEPFFDTERQDRQFDAAAGLHWVPAPSWRVTPQIVATRVRSNVVLYDYRRTVVQLAVRKDF